MIKLPVVIAACGSPNFKGTLKLEIEQLDATLLPLQQGLSTGSHVSDTAFQTMIITVADEPEYIRARAGIFYTSVIAGCNCADDPTPIDENNEYCEIQIDIDKNSAVAKINLVSK